MKKLNKIIVITGTILLFIPAGVQAAQETGLAKGVEEMDRNQEYLNFMIEKYNFTAEELADIDLERFIEDYDLYGLDYTAEEVQQILSDERDMYIDDGSTERFKIFEQESDDSLSPAAGITRIGYYYNEGTLFQRMVFDFENKVWFLNKNDAVPLTESDSRMLLSLDEEYHVFQWDANYEGEEKETTGSLRWKLVFEFENGAYRSFGGYTRDMSHLPEDFWDVDAAIRGIVKGNK